MKKKRLEDHTPEQRKKIHADLHAKLQKGDSSAKAEVIDMLKDNTLPMGSPEKNMALELVEKNKLTESIHSLYPLLKQTVISGIGGTKDPAAAMISIGANGLPLLLQCIEEDDENSIPYPTITGILFHWFNNDRAALKAFLGSKEKDSTSASKKYSRLISVVDNWK